MFANEAAKWRGPNGFLQTAIKLPPAPRTRASQDDPQSMILDTFCNFGHLAGSLCLGGLRRPGARIIRSWARTGGNKVPAPAGGAWSCFLNELDIHS